MVQKTWFQSREIITKTQKMVLDAFLLNTQHYKILIKNKWSNPGKGVVPSPTPQCSSYWKGSLWAALDYSQPTYLLYDIKYFYLIQIICEVEGVGANVLDCIMVLNKFKLQSFPFGLIPLRKARNPLFPQLWVRYYNYSSFTRMALALNHPWKLIWH